jgi:hypothetical protein
MNARGGIPQTLAHHGPDEQAQHRGSLGSRPDPYPHKSDAYTEDARPRTFRPSRHAHLLETEDVPLEFEHFARRYRAATSDRERRAAANDLLDAVRVKPALELSMAQELHAVLGPETWLMRMAGLSLDEYEELGREWVAWDAKWGRWWLRQQLEGRKPHERRVPYPPGFRLVSPT